MDAARHVGRNERPEVLVHHDALVLVVARAARAVPDREILKLAFAALVADRAVERMVDEQKLHYAFLRVDCELRVRPDLHAFGGRGRAGRQRFGRLLDVHQAHAAVGRDRQLLVIAEMRHVNAKTIGSIHDGAAFGHFERPAVDLELDHGVSRISDSPIAPRPAGEGGSPNLPEGGGTNPFPFGRGVGVRELNAFICNPARDSFCGRCGAGTRRGSA